jgi:hypothetical protein
MDDALGLAAASDESERHWPIHGPGEAEFPDPGADWERLVIGTFLIGMHPGRLVAGVSALLARAAQWPRGAAY